MSTANQIHTQCNLFIFIQERGWWKDIKNQHDEKEEISQGRKQTEKKSQAKPDDNTSQKRVGFCEGKECQSPTSRKRPAFRDKKILVDSGDVKSSQIDHPPKREEKISNPYNMDRAHYKGKAARDGVLSRERQRGNDGYGNSSGSEKFNGRQGYLPSKTQTKNWKHDS